VNFNRLPILLTCLLLYFYTPPHHLHIFFHNVQHPGNILLLKDGRLGLIDYGQVKFLEDKHRIIYAKLILALNRDDRQEIIRLYNKEMGILTKNNLDDVLYRHAVFYHDRDTVDITQGLNMHLFLEKLESMDPVKHISEEYIMVGRVNMLLRGVSKAFGLQIKMSDLWKTQAEAYLKSKGEL
jgi:aarF domain-containing kinase